MIKIKYFSSEIQLTNMFTKTCGKSKAEFIFDKLSMFDMYAIT